MILKRLLTLENMMGVRRLPTFDEFILLWSGMDELSKSLFLMFGENPDDTDDAADKEYFAKIGEYLRRMGLKDDSSTQSLREIAAQLDERRCCV